jgi:hypothetical protein
MNYSNNAIIYVIPVCSRRSSYWIPKEALEPEKAGGTEVGCRGSKEKETKCFARQI